MIKRKDIIDIPLSNVDWFFLAWIVYVLITIVPGTLLWIFTLGAFRYFNLSQKLCEYLVNQELRIDR